MPLRQQAVERWLQVVRIMEEEDFELTIEEFVGIFKAFRQLKHSGHPVDRGLNALINVLIRQTFNTDEDSDTDGSDRGLQ